MKGFTYDKALTPWERQNYHGALLRVQAFPDCDQHGAILRCHEVARAVRASLGEPGLFVVDGKMGAYDHSWIAYAGEGYLGILDPYAVASIPLVQLHADRFRTQPYVPGHIPRNDIREDVVEWLTEIAEQALRESRR